VQEGHMLKLNAEAQVYHLEWFVMVVYRWLQEPLAVALQSTVAYQAKVVRRCPVVVDPTACLWLGPIRCGHYLRPP
jgi:hypothetical protein